MADYNYDQSLYQHEVLLYAIDFFSQSFELNDIMEYTLDFSNEILTLNNSALFIYKNNKFSLEKSKNYNLSQYSIKATEKLNKLPVFHGQILYSDYDKYFNKKDLNILKPQLIIPLFIKETLHGFIVTGGKTLGEFNKRDFLIANTLMRLANMSLENTHNFLNLKEKNKELDNKIFDLFFVNQTSRSLLSELNIESLYTLCTDVIGEVSCSKITTFGLYDELSEKIILRNYRDIASYQKNYCEFQMKKREYKGSKIILNYHDDIDIIKEYFVNWQDFRELNSKYIILLVKNDIIGFVTISDPVNDRNYDRNMFELIESLISTIYLAINNARLFKVVSDQKESLERKLNTLKKLNHLIKRVNSSKDIDGVCNNTTQILSIGFDIEKFFISIRDNNQYRIVSEYGFDTEEQILLKNNHWDEIDQEGVFYHFDSSENSKYLDEKLLRDIGESNCLVIAPMTIEDNFEKETIGYIVILKTDESLSEEEVLLIDTIANSITPVVKQMKEVQRIEKNYILNPEKILLESLDQMLFNKQEYNIDFTIYYKKITKKPFQEPVLDNYEEYNYVYLDNYIFIFVEENIDIELDTNLYDYYFSVDKIDDFYKEIRKLYQK